MHPLYSAVDHVGAEVLDDALFCAMVGLAPVRAD